MKNRSRTVVSDKIAEKIQRRKYYMKVDGKFVEDSWEQVSLRVAKHAVKGYVKSAEEAGLGVTAEDRRALLNLYYNYIKNKVFLPGGRVLANAGTKVENLINCYISDIEDSRHGIYSVLHDVAEIHAKGGGTGINFSNLREEGAYINSTGGEACFTGDTKVLTTDGLINISSVVPGETQVVLPEGVFNVDKLHRNGIKDVVLVTFDDGRKIKTTLEHAFYVFEGSTIVKKNLRDITLDDNLVYTFIDQAVESSPHVLSGEVVREIISGEFNLELTEELAYLLGMIAGDGHVSISNRRSQIGITCNVFEKDIRAKIRNILDSLDVNYSEKKRAKLGRSDFFIRDSLFVDFLNQNGLLKISSKDMFVPDIIFSSGFSVRLAYFSGWFDAEGSVKDNRIRAKTICKKFAYQIQELLTSLGVKTTVRKHERKIKAWNDVYVIDATGSFWNNRLVSIGKNFSIKLNYYSLEDPHVNGPLWWPFNALKELVSLPTVRAKFILPYNSKSTGITPVNRIKKEVAARGLNDAVDKIDSLLPYSLIKITSIEPIGSEEVFDIEVAEEHRYIVNGVLVSNSGPVSFMELFNVSANVIKQASRRGAMLASLNSNHPDILKFIRAKGEQGKLENFNISVGLKDQTIEDYLAGDELAREIIETISYYAWKRGDPGILFIDTLNKLNSIPHLGAIVTCNPCGEVPGADKSDCNLSSLNLVMFVRKIGKDKYIFDLPEFIATIPTAVSFLDSIVSISTTGLESYDTRQKLERKIGLGVMGFADVLAYLDIPYDSKDALGLAAIIGGTLYREAQKMSQVLAKDFGPYAGYDPEKSYDPILGEPQKPQRNANLISIAPTGTISQISRVNFSIEPFFLLAYKKNLHFGSSKAEDSVVVSLPVVEDILHDYFEGDTLEDVLDVVGTTGKLETSPTFTDEVNEKIIKLQPRFKTAMDISPEDHIKMQAAWQQNVDLAISKTINMPNSATVEDVTNAIILAWKLGLKGFTVYRDGCRSDQIMEKPDDPQK